MNILNKTKTYLAGPMEFSNGRKWREDATESLRTIGVQVFNPYLKPFLNSVEEDESTHEKLYFEISLGNEDSVYRHMQQIRRFDLNCVDKSDFLIFYINKEIPTFGTMEELTIAVKCKKPIFIFVEGGRQNCPLWIRGMIPPKYIYSSLEEILDIIKKIDSGEKEIDNERWRLLIHELR